VADIKPEPHLSESVFVGVTRTKEIVNVGFEYTMEGCSTLPGNVEYGTAYYMNKIVRGVPMPKVEPRVNVENAVNVESKQGPVARTDGNLPKG